MMRQLSGIGKLSRQFLSGAVHGFVRVCVAHTCSKTGTCPVCKVSSTKAYVSVRSYGLCFSVLEVSGLGSNRLEIDPAGSWPLCQIGLEHAPSSLLHM